MTTTADMSGEQTIVSVSFSDISDVTEVQMGKPERLRSGERCFSWIMMAISITVLILAYKISGFAVCAPGTFPLAAAAVMVIAMAFVLIDNYRRPGPDVKNVFDEIHRAMNRLLPRVIVVYTFIIIGYMLIIQPLHFFPSTFLFLFISIIYLRGAGWLRALFISAGALAAVYVIFQFIFKVTLP